MIKKIVKKILRTPAYLYNKSRFAEFGEGSTLQKPLRIEGAENIHISSDVHIRSHAWLAAMPLTGKQVRLEIRNGTVIGDFAHIYATESIVIGENVLFANHVYASDNLHSYENVSMPVISQPILQKKCVIIGDGTWIGENAVILGAKIGRNCVIGSNAVVTSDIPDYSVVVGVPAKIIKRYDAEQKIWRRTYNDGSFI